MTVLALVHCCKYAPYVPEFSFLSSHLALVFWCCGSACSSSFSAAGGSTFALQRTNMCTDGSTFSLQRMNMCTDGSTFSLQRTNMCTDGFTFSLQRTNMCTDGSTFSLQRTNMCTEGSTFSLQRTNMCTDGSTFSLQRTNMCTDGSTFSLQRTNMCADANWCVSSSLSGCNDYTTLAEHHFPDNSYERNHLKYSCELLHGEWMFSLKYFCFTAAVMIAGLCREWKLVQVCGSFAQYLCKCVSVTCSVRVQVCVLSLFQYLCKCVSIICSVLVQVCVCHLFNTCASVWMPLVQYLFSVYLWPVQ